jgi:hypothetical protein
VSTRSPDLSWFRSWPREIGAGLTRGITMSRPHVCDGCGKSLEGAKDSVAWQRRRGDKTESGDYCRECNERAESFLAAAFEMDDDEPEEQPQQVTHPDIIPEGDLRLDDAQWQIEHGKEMGNHARAKLAQIAAERAKAGLRPEAVNGQQRIYLPGKIRR